MKGSITSRGFELIEWTSRHGVPCTLQQSSAIDAEDPEALGRAPGTSFVWLGVANQERMQLGRDEVAKLIRLLSNWLEHGTFGGGQP